ncbi:hypothetical protein [Siphonobacter sp. SORGH_AS_0500]|uniref:hypothetical protein n=1 Tax=Siphonobacter sp. SORGH_AS_0500 TaxID=1864824 RepID=UPI000CBAE8DB|nr:hypothetical protein [Siphonobacter sp. SORGH_AS_0500]MDR6193010.1 HJR/Mrr/RecB family endonuclease [Siphonobacter sp. SORGH_AS_0500]PKK35707.1 hypothetical protein BWI96_15475 [Siphonobacter sp. SORGH_AS_0500]
MRIDFDQMPDHARLWVYQANRTLSATEQEVIQSQLQASFEEWAAHGQPLTNAVTVLQGRFVLLAVDEKAYAASGCSIDASTRIIGQIGQQAGIDFFDRSIVFKTEDGIDSVDGLKGKSAVKAGTIQHDTIIFNNQVKTVGEFRANWELPASESWMKRFFVGVVS